MADTVVEKEKIETAIQNGRLVRGIGHHLHAEVKEFKGYVADYAKDNKLSFGFMYDVSEKLKNFNEEAKEIARVMETFPAVRLAFLEDRIERKVKHEVSDDVSLTDTELSVVDWLLSDEVKVFYEKYSERDYFIKNDIYNVADLFTDEEINEAFEQRKRNVMIYALIGLVVIGHLAYLYVEHNF